MVLLHQPERVAQLKLVGNIGLQEELLLHYFGGVCESEGVIVQEEQEQKLLDHVHMSDSGGEKPRYVFELQPENMERLEALAFEDCDFRAEVVDTSEQPSILGKANLLSFSVFEGLEDFLCERVRLVEVGQEKHCVVPGGVEGKVVDLVKSGQCRALEGLFDQNLFSELFFQLESNDGI